VTIYTEFVPWLLAAHTSRPEYTRMPAPLEFSSFDDALDEFFSKQEAQKEEMRLIKEKAQALLKLEREKARQAQQLAALANQQAVSTLKAQLIEQNLDAVNACIGSVNAEIAKGTDWRELTRTIKAERETNNNPIARMIHSLKLLENHITVTLSDGMRHLLPPVPGQKRVEVQQVELDLGLSAFSNAQLYYTNKKQHAQKQQKAESASALALKAAERKTNVALSAVDQRARIQKSRKVFWVSHNANCGRQSAIDSKLSLMFDLRVLFRLSFSVGEIPLVHFL
jgi:predicted ribosome quality control (RQC) complex YloA/Tae2 family protein